MFLPILALALAAPAPEPPPDAPKGPAPKVMVLNVDKDGRPCLEAVVTTYTTKQETYIVQVNGHMEVRTRQVSVPVMEQRRIALDADGVAVYGADGKKLDPKNLPKLGGPVPALLSADGKEVDPFYLGLAKSGTLVVVAPSLAGAEPAPAADPRPPLPSPPKP